MIAPDEDKDYITARAGDHLFCPFECDACTFYRLKGRLPEARNITDSTLLVYLRRANLDAFWSRRPGTIEGLRTLFFRQAKVGVTFGFDMFDSPGPFPSNYDSGIRCAVGVLHQSRLPGLHEATQKYSSVRKVRSLSTNLYNASALGAVGNVVYRTKQGRNVATSAPTESEWFSRFMSGLHARMGDRRKRDAAISIKQILAIQSLLEEEWHDAIDGGELSDKRAVAEIGVFFILGYCTSLRGFEMPKIVLTNLRSMIQLLDDDDSSAHVAVPLRGCFKARSSQIVDLLVYAAATTHSGLKPALWTLRLVDVLEECGVTRGWLFQESDGRQRRLGSFSDAFYARLFAIRDRDPTLFTVDIDILEDYGLARSLRRGATTRATNAKVSQPDIDWVNRWSTGGDEISDGPMRVIYSDRKQLLDTFLRFSLAL